MIERLFQPISNCIVDSEIENNVFGLIRTIMPGVCFHCMYGSSSYRRVEKEIAELQTEDIQHGLGILRQHANAHEKLSIAHSDQDEFEI